jgi:hypothetical protein
MIEYIILGLCPVIGFVGWLIGYAMGSKDYEKLVED